MTFVGRYLIMYHIVVVVQWLSHVRLFAGFSRQQYWSELPLPSPGDLPGPGIGPISPALAGRFFTIESPGKPSYHFTVLFIVTLEITRVYPEFVGLPFPNKARTLDYLHSIYSSTIFCPFLLYILLLHIFKISQDSITMSK